MASYPSSLHLITTYTHYDNCMSAARNYLSKNIIYIAFFSVYQRLNLNNSSACRFCHPTSSLLTQKQAVSVIQNNLHEGMSFIFDFLEEKSLYYMEYSFLEIFVESLDSLFLASFDVTHAHIDGKNCPPPTEHIALDFHMIQFV